MFWFTHVNLKYVFTGEQHIDIEHNIYKRRLDLDGKPIDEAQKDNNLGAVSKIVNNTILTGDEAKNDTNLGNFKWTFTSCLRLPFFHLTVKNVIKVFMPIDV